MNIHDSGYWSGNTYGEHYYDEDLSKSLLYFFNKENIKYVNDFGCGDGLYVKELNSNNIKCIGYDGNPNTKNINNCFIKNLAVNFRLENKPEWIISLEVGEHIPKTYEKIFINNLDKNNTKGIIISWAIKGQGGSGHVNEQNNEYIKNIFVKLGYKNEKEIEKYLRCNSKLPWFKNTIMVFRKINI